MSRTQGEPSLAQQLVCHPMLLSGSYTSLADRTDDVEIKVKRRNNIGKQLTITKSCRTETLFGHENFVPPKGDTEAEHHALMFFS